MPETSQTIVHPSAIVEPGARLGMGVRVGAFCLVGADAVLGDGVELASHVVIEGHTTLGNGCKVSHHAVLGGAPQNSKHQGGPTRLVVGSNCTIREYVTMHRGTDTSRGETTIGENGNFLAYTHIAHDCIVGRNVTMANVATLGGHCEIGDFVGIGGLTAVHQFTRIGHHAFLGAVSGVVSDVIPYGITLGNRGQLRGLNVIGMKRSGLAREDILAMRRAYRVIFDRARPVSENLDIADRDYGASPAVRDVIDFLRNRGKRPYAVPPLGKSVDSSDDDD